MPKKSFRFEVFSMHGHIQGGVADYLRLLTLLTGLRGYHSESGGHNIAVGRASLENGQLFLVVYTGFSEKSTLFFDVNSKEELTEATLPGRFPARKTYAMIDAAKRMLLIETKRGTLSAFSLSSLIERYSKSFDEFKTLELVFNPVADSSFADRLNSFSRIQGATITIGRPNFDWTDRHDQLTAVASESDAKSLDVTAHAKRGKSLSKNRGLIDFIRVGASSAKTMFQKIKVVGAITENSGLITLDLNKHVQHLNLSLEIDPKTNLPNEVDVRVNLSSYINGAKTEDGEK